MDTENTSEYTTPSTTENGVNNSGDVGQFADNPNAQLAEFNHLEQTQKQEQEHKRDMLQLKHQHTLEMLDRWGGDFGHYFGQGENSSKHIAFLIILVFLFASFALILIFYKESPHSPFVELVWNTSIPVLTLALGYIFGKK